MTVDQLLEDHTPEIADLTRRLLERIQSAASWKELRVYPGWHGIGLHHPDLGYVVGLFPRVDVVRVLFEHGALLGTARFLEGLGSTRFVDFEDWDLARVAVVDDLVDRALAI